MIHYLPLSWSIYQTLTQKLAAAILDQVQPLDEIIAISRGGLTFGHLLSDFLRIPISVIAIQSYSDIQTHGEVKITAGLQNSIERKRILLVDDVADSGLTLKRAVSYLKEFNPSSVTSVTMFYKPNSVIRPDYFARQTTKWILFPYEPTEMILLLTRQMEKDGKTKAQIQKMLERLHYSDSQISFVRKHHLK